METIIYFLCLSPALIVSYNIDINNPIIYLDQTNFIPVKPSDKSSYFGHSVILYPGNNENAPWIQIGAPRGNSPHLNDTNPGIVFRCNVRIQSEQPPCIPVEVDLGHEHWSIKKNAWIGAVMDINSKSNLIVVCSPRWTYHYLSRTTEDYRMIGACYWSDLHSMDYNKMLPLSRPSKALFSQGKINVYNWAQGQAGFSAHIPEKEDEILLGAPGVFNWKGTTLKYKEELDGDNAVVSSLTQGFTKLIVADARKTIETQDFGLFGYAVTSGYFYPNKTLYYVAGGPKSNNYYGQIIVSEFDSQNDKPLLVVDMKQGTQFGEYFGASLAAGDIDGDGLDDLIVGSPYYKASKCDEGRIYLFLGNDNGRSLRTPKKGEYIDGKYPKGQFGRAITYLGDMNNNGEQYVAVSAPYEEGSGVVYIFRGISRKGLDDIPVQRIVGSSILPNIAGFGVSISKPADMDGNGYKDIAIGSYKSGHVVLLRSRPLNLVYSTFTEVPSQISNDATVFDVHICHGYRSYKGMDSIDIIRKIVVDEDLNRAFLKSSNVTKNITLFRNENFCETVTIELRDSWSKDDKSLTIKVSHSIIEKKIKPSKMIIGLKTEGEDEFCPRCGVYDRSRSIQSETKQIPHVFSCEGGRVCVSELEFESHFKGTGVVRNNTFILGATNVIELQTIVKNLGDVAYQLRILVELPEELSFKQTPTECEQNGTRINCLVQNSLRKNAEKSFSLKLDMDFKNERMVENFVLINVTVLTKSTNKNKASKIYRLNFETEADVYISGKSGEQSYSFGLEDKKKIDFQQIYQIGKVGLSPVALVNFEIYIPYAMKSSSQTINFLNLSRPEGSFAGQRIYFNSNINFSNPLSFDEPIDDQEMEIRNKREIFNQTTYSPLEISTLRSVSAKLEYEGFDLSESRTFEINCNNSDVFICAKISGSTGPFDGLKKSAVLQLKMQLNTESLSGVLQEKKVIKYSTYGKVRISIPSELMQSGDKPDDIFVSSLFVTDDSKISTWIFLVAIIAGFFLLSLLTLALMKAGFFKRTQKAQLKQLKAKMEERSTDQIEEENEVNEDIVLD